MKLLFFIGFVVTNKNLWYILFYPSSNISLSVLMVDLLVNERTKSNPYFDTSSVVTNISTDAYLSLINWKGFSWLHCIIEFCQDASIVRRN